MAEDIGSVEAVINKIQTTADGGARLTLDLNASDAVIISKLMAIKLHGEEVIIVRFER